MKIAITGGTGQVGQFFVDAAKNDDVTLLGRDLPFRLGDRPDLNGFDLLIHCAFVHVAGRYRGGEGDDPAGFIRANLHGSIALFEAAKSCGVPRTVFLSSRAVYGDYPAGTTLYENMPLKPDTLYGEVKAQAEQALADMSGNGFVGQSLRATGVYGGSKWDNLITRFLSGHVPSPRAGTEVHGDDLAAAIGALHGAPSGAYNISDIMLDRRDLLARVADITDCKTPLPAAQTEPTSAMSTELAQSYGWRSGGWDRLEQTLPSLIKRSVA